MTDKIAVTLVTHYFSTHRGGVEQAASQLAARLAETGDFSIEWFASDSDTPPPATSNLSTHPMRAWNALEKLGLPWPLWSPRALSALRASIRACDIVHLHDFIYFGNIVAFCLARKYKKPIVITQHIGDATYINRLHAIILKLINRTIGRLMLSRASQIICISDEVRRQFVSHINFKTAPLFWPNALDTSIFHPADDTARNALRKQLNVDSDWPVLLFVGRFVEMKGLSLLKQLAITMPHAHWWFAGWGQQEMKLHPSNWKLGNVRVFDDRSGSAIADLYRACDLLVLPSFSEGFPLVVQEAMACGTTPLVSSEAAIGSPAAKPWVHVCALAPAPTAPARWKSALLELLKDDSITKRRESIAAFAKEEWSWELSVSRYRELLKKLTQPSR